MQDTRISENQPINSSKKGTKKQRRSIFDVPEPTEPQRIRRAKNRRVMIKNYRSNIREIYHQTDYLVDWKDEDLSCFITPIENTGCAAMMGRSSRSDTYSTRSSSQIRQSNVPRIIDKDSDFLESNPTITTLSLNETGASQNFDSQERGQNDDEFEPAQTGMQITNFPEEEADLENSNRQESAEHFEEEEEHVDQNILRAMREKNEIDLLIGSFDEYNISKKDDSHIEEEEEVYGQEENDMNFEAENEEEDEIYGQEENDINIEAENDDDEFNDQDEIYQVESDQIRNEDPIIEEEIVEYNQFENESVEVTLLGVGDLPVNDSQVPVFVTVQLFSDDSPIGDQYKIDVVEDDDPQVLNLANVNQQDLIEFLVWQNNEGGEPSLISGIRMDVNSIDWEETGSQFFDLVSADDLRAGSNVAKGSFGNIAVIFNLLPKEEN